MKKKKAKIIVGFTGTGKSDLVSNRSSKDLIILDLDSGDYSNIGCYDDGKRNPEYPVNCVKAIIDKVYCSDVILISAIGVVIDSLIDEGYEVTLVYPSLDLKQEYRDRYYSRKSTVAVAEMLTNNFDKFVRRAENQKACEKIVLKSDQYLSDVLPQILNP